MKIALLITLFIASSTAITTTVYAEQSVPSMQTMTIAHSGGTDSKGCHYNRKTGEYHCHKPK